MKLTDADYEHLLDFRSSLRRYLHWSEEQAAGEGITTAQHQLLLAVRGSATPGGPTIGQVSELLLLKHHSTVELVGRAEQAGLVERRGDAHDRRVVRVALTPRGRAVLERLAARHLAELREIAPALSRVLEAAARAPVS
jgi:DNA-binding MarR family transcriptional regulator